MNSLWAKISKLFYFYLAFGLILSFSCHINRLESNLTPDDADFLSKVRYIITPEERKIFLELPEEEKAQFREEFWKRRDPDPETEVNEFKETYSSRVEEANRLFSIGKPGWLTDRGEIYILFGPPTNRDKYPMGFGPGTRPREIWYYGLFPIVFVDLYGTGEYTRIEEDVIHIHEVNKALEVARRTLRYEAQFFDFRLDFKKERNKHYVIVGIPYKNLWLSSIPEGGKTILSLAIEIQDRNDRVVWNFKKDISIELTDEELQEKKDKGFIMRIPVELSKGKYKLYAFLINQTGKKESRKSLEIEI